MMSLEKNPSTTVLMVTYNAGKYIYESINSILNQTFMDFELLIYNDGSTDNTHEIVNSIKDSRIRYLHNDTNYGLFHARRVALEASFGKYIAILDSDDVAFPERLRVQYNFMEKNPLVALCGSNAVVIDSDGKRVDERINKVRLKENDLKAELFFTNIFVNSSTMFRKDVALQVGGYRDMAPVEDYDLFVRIAEKHPIYVFNEAFVYYRRHSDNISVKENKVGDSYLIEIKKDQLRNLNIPEVQYGPLFFDLLHWKFDGVEVNECLNFLTTLKNNNRQYMIFPLRTFERKLFSIWYNFITSVMNKRDMLPYLLNSDLFSLSNLNRFQAKKILKLHLKKIARRSINR